MTRSKKACGDDLVISYCKDGKAALLKEVLNDKTLSLSKSVIKAFYHAIASNDTNLLNTLVLNFPLKVYLDLFLSKCYEEIILNRIQLSEEMDRLVQNFLFDFRFEKNDEDDATQDSSEERIKMLLEIIGRTVDSDQIKFASLGKLIVQNIFVLKQSLKRSYIAVPWEEMEFLLAIFIRTHNFCIKAIPISSLTKPKMCEYLNIFASIIKNFFVDKSSYENVFPPDQTREITVERIIIKHPKLEEFYKDYTLIHDMDCLWEICNYANIALSNDMTELEKKFLIHKAVSVFSKFMSDSFESPGLSLETRLRLYLLSPQNMRDLFIDLMVAPHLSTMLETSNVQNLLLNLKANIISIITQCEINAIKIILQDIADPNTSIEVLNEKSAAFKDGEPDMGMISNIRLIEVKKLKNFVDNIEKQLEDSTIYERFMFEQIDKSLFTLTNNEKFSHFSWFKALSQNVDNREGVYVKQYVALSLIPHFSKKISSENVHNILSCLYEILESIYSRKVQERSIFDDQLLIDLFLLSDFETENPVWLFDLKNKFLSAFELKIDQSLMNIKEPESIKNSINEIVINYVKNDSSINVEEMVKNCKIKTVFELYVSEVSKSIKFQKKFLNEYTPLWTGCYLKSGFDSFDVRFFDPKFALVANTRRFLSFKKKFTTKFVVPKMGEKFEFICSILDNQEKMFDAFLRGDSEVVHECLKTVDIRSKNPELWTVHHFASRGPNVELLKFVLKSLPGHDLKDINGNTPLHIAALHGRTENVEVLIKLKSNVDIKNNMDVTPLHLAALNAHEDVVKMLLRHGASYLSYDVLGRIPLAYCFKERNIDVCRHEKVAKIILDVFENVNIRIQINGITPLHFFVTMNNLEMVKYSCYRKADVNHVSLDHQSPLHFAAININCDLDIVRCLVTHGADINASDETGYTPLMYAVQFENTELASFLMRNGAIVKNLAPSMSSLIKNGSNMAKRLLENYTFDDSDMLINLAAQYNETEILKILLSKKISVNTQALHLASCYGHVEAAEILIKYNFKVNQMNPEGKTPLHVAVENGRKALVELLIKNNADLHMCTKQGKTALHLAAHSGRVDIINLLINQSSIETYTGLSPLHIAVACRHHDAAESLLQCQALKMTLTENMTPFHFAVLDGDIKMIQILMDHDAFVDQRDDDIAPLILACGKGYKKVVELLIASGANVNAEYNKVTPLLAAIQNSQNPLIDILVANGADVNSSLGRPLIKAIIDGNLTAFECLLDNHAYLNIKDERNMTPLHFAASSPNCLIVQTLINRGAIIDAITKDFFTPLHLAVERSYEKNVLVLLASGALVNQRNKYKRTPLHLASTKDNLEIVKHLLSHGAKIFLRDQENKTPLDYAILHCHSNIVELLLKHTDPKRRLENLLFMASEVNNVETLTFLINHGFDAHEKSSSGLKPIHHAAAKGLVPVVDFYIKKGLSVNEADSNNKTLLHYAVQNKCTEVIQFLVSSGAKINAKDSNGSTPICIAAESGFTEIVKILLKNGSVCKNNDKIFDFNAKNIIDFSNLLLKATRNNKSDEIEVCIKKGAVIDCKDQTGLTPLHIASWKGHDEIVDILIKNEVNVNSMDFQFYTPLHYAVRCSHIDIVKKLLSNAAVYNAQSQRGEKPADLTKNPDLNKLFKIIDDLFKSVENNDCEIINELRELDVDSIKAIMGSKNRNGRTATLLAIDNHFSKYEDLVSVGQNYAVDYLKAVEHYNKKEFDTSLGIFEIMYKIKKNLLGADNPSTLSIKLQIAHNYVGKKNFDTALSIYSEIFTKFSNFFGLNHVMVLDVRASIAILFLEKVDFRDGYDDILSTCEVMKKYLQPKDPVLIRAQLYLAFAHEKNHHKDQALELNIEILKNSTDFYHIKNALVNMTRLLCEQGKVPEAAAEIKQTYLMVKYVYGATSEKTKSIMDNFMTMVLAQGKYKNDTRDLEFILEELKNFQGYRQKDRVLAEFHLADNLFNEGKIIKAHAHYESVLKLSKEINSFDSLVYFKARDGLKDCLFSLGLEYGSGFTFLSSIIKGQTKVVLSFIKEGININELIDGKTPLHIAVQHSRLEIVELLMENGADALQVSNKKGNTPLHAAVALNSIEMTELLLKKSKKTSQLVNAKTTGKCTTALHIAAEKGFYEITLLLMKYGAVFNAPNSAARSPLDLSKGNIYDILKTTEIQFKYAVIGDTSKLDKLRALQPNEFSAVTNARNRKEKTLLQVAIFFKNNNYAKNLTEMLREKKI